MDKIRWNEVALPGCAFHFGRVVYRPGERFGMHSHDFAEVMLVEAGSGRQQINGVLRDIHAGDLYFIRPNDRHMFRAGSGGLILLNCAFPFEKAAELELRYFPDEPGYFRSTGKMPCSFVLQSDVFVRAVALMNELAGRVRNCFALDHALLSIYDMIRYPLADSIIEGAPDWLRHACSEIRTPAQLGGGVSSFVRLAGRSPEHVARATKRFTGKTPTVFINEFRLELAAKLLCITGRTVLEVALECGFENLSWFHRSFRARYGVTPLQYRKQNLMPITYLKTVPGKSSKSADFR